MQTSPSPAFQYEVYGISLRSEICLTLPKQPTETAPDVTLSLASREWFETRTADLPRSPSNGDWYEHVACPDGSDYLSWPALFEFMISADGRSVACRPLARSSIESFQTYLLGHALSFALVKQKHEPLHATSVVINGSAVAFLGPSGQGKSTLAAAFLHSGHQLLTDDMLLIRAVGGLLCGFPGPPRIKLFADVAQRFLPEGAPLARMNPDSQKLVIALGEGQAHIGPVPIHSFFVLDGEEARRLEISRLAGREGQLALLGATFNKRLVNPARLRRQFLVARDWTNQVPIKRLAYDWTIGALDEVCQTVVADLNATSQVLV